MNKDFKFYYIIQEICKEHDIEISLMPGATAQHTTFRLGKTSFKFGSYKSSNHTFNSVGVISGSVITLGVRNNRRSFDLYDPNSISEITEYISTGKMWQ